MRKKGFQRSNGSTSKAGFYSGAACSVSSYEEGAGSVSSSDSQGARNLVEYKGGL
jgi:hypothetical protein